MAQQLFIELHDNQFWKIQPGRDRLSKAWKLKVEWTDISLFLQTT